MKRIRRYICTLAVVAGLSGAVSGAVLAAPDAGPSAAAIVDAAPTADAGPAVEPEKPKSTVPAALEDAEKLYDAYKDLKNRDETIPLRVAIAIFGSVVLNVLIGWARRLDWIDKRKRWIPLTIVALGAIAAVLDHLATGSGYVAAITGSTGAFAVLYHQIKKQFFKAS